MFAAGGISSPLGRALLLVGIIGSLFGAIAAISSARSRDQAVARLIPRFAILIFAAAVGAFATMEYAMITRDFSMAYVQKVGSTATPALYNFAAVWSALEGSILMWVLILAGYTLAVCFWLRKKMDDVLANWAMGVMFIVSTFFFLLSFGPANPFAKGAPGVFDGPGPNPLLQNHILVLFHPPLLYLGYVGVTVPFAFAIGALVTGRVGEGWLLATRRWTLFAWGFLTFGIILGSWWSYEVLGWSGVWAWDPVENASLLPWITATAYIHSVLVQERRGMLRVWNLSLLVSTFSLTILGTFLTRSGVLNSVHAFSESAIGPWLLVFFGIIVIVSIGLIGWRGDRLHAPGSIDSVVSREGAFLINNVLFAVFAFVVLLGTVFPLVIEALAMAQGISRVVEHEIVLASMVWCRGLGHQCRCWSNWVYAAAYICAWWVCEWVGLAPGGVGYTQAGSAGIGWSHKRWNDCACWRHLDCGSARCIKQFYAQPRNLLEDRHTRLFFWTQF